MFLFMLQEEKLQCEVYLSEISQPAWEKRKIQILPVEVDCQNSVAEPIPVLPPSLCSHSWNRQENALFPQNSFTASLHTHKCMFVTFPILFFFPWIISHVFCDSFNEGMMLHSCNISLILKDQGSTLPAQLLQPRFLYPPRTTELAQPPVGKGIFSCSLLVFL